MKLQVRQNPAGLAELIDISRADPVRQVAVANSEEDGQAIALAVNCHEMLVRLAQQSLRILDGEEDIDDDLAEIAFRANLEFVLDEAGVTPPWCEACWNYHVQPTDAEHHAALRCQAPFKPT